MSEILSPTIQHGPGDVLHGGQGGGGGGGGGGGDGGDGSGGQQDRGAVGGRWNGSYHCQLYNRKRKCDVCSYMPETSTVYSYYFKRNFAIHGHNVHLPASQKDKNKWFIYLCEDKACKLLYVGSTTDVCGRWASTKKACMDGNLSNTGLYKHFMTGCPEYQTNGDLSHLKWVLVDYLNTSAELLQQAGHVGGAKCRCTECQKLKELEDKWICRLGTFYGQHGLNTRDEVKSRSRVNFKGS